MEWLLPRKVLMLAQVLSEVRTTGEWLLLLVPPAILVPGEHSKIRTAGSGYCRVTGSVDVGTGIKRGQNCGW